MGMYCFGIDVGGTSVKCGLFLTNGTLVEQWEIPTRLENNGSSILPDVADAIKTKLDERGITKDNVDGVGIGIPGPVNENGEVPMAVNLHWGFKAVASELSALTGLPAKAANDANIAALGEAWKGAAEGSKNVILVTLGTGVGGGIVAEGKLLHGAGGVAGELGHITVDFDRPFDCTCGKKGCLETVASATGIVNLTRRYADEYAGDATLKRLIDDGEEVTAKTVFDLAKDGDELALIVYRHFSQYLGIACANIASVLNPANIVIGGGVSAAGQFLLDGVQKVFDENTFPQVRTSTQLVLANLGNDAGVIGAASLVLQ